MAPPTDRSPESRPGGNGFWRWPSPWVWFIFSLSMLILAASMLTLREDLRIHSRALTAGERTLVAAALKTWTDVGVETSLAEQVDLSRVRAMDVRSFTRPEERQTYGYTDKRQRILLNPELCFAAYRGVSVGDNEVDIVPTMVTLFHEALHRFHHLSEAEAYEREWRFVRSCKAATARPRLRRELQRWEDELPERIEQFIGPGMSGKIYQRLSQPTHEQ